MDLSILLKVLCCCIILVKADECEQRSPCSCVYPNGTGIDLAQSARNRFFISNNQVVTDELENDPMIILNTQSYFFHPCYDILMHNRRAEGGVEYCSVYRYYEHLLKPSFTINSGFEVIGTVNHSHFASDAEGIYINYSWPLSTKVYLSCAEGEDKLLISRWDPEVILEFYSRNACLQQLETTVSALSLPRWMEVQWSKVSQAVKESYAHVVDGLRWLVPQPLERMPSFMGRT